MVFVLIFLSVVIVALVYLIGLYNHLVEIKNEVGKAWANIDVLLKQRHDELPKLVEVCQQYKKFEQETLRRVVAARLQVQSARETQNVAALGQAEGSLRASLGGLFAVAESYPELKANEQYMQLQERISDLETGIAYRREFYNESVKIYNVGIEQFPSVMIAELFRFGSKRLLAFSAEEKADVNIKQIFS